jgi:hypothetical protein
MSTKYPVILAASAAATAAAAYMLGRAKYVRVIPSRAPTSAVRMHARPAADGPKHWPNP